MPVLRMYHQNRFAQKFFPAVAEDGASCRIAFLDPILDRIHNEHGGANAVESFLKQNVVVRGGVPSLVIHVPDADGNLLRMLGDGLKKRQFEGVAVFGGESQGRCSFACFVSAKLTTRWKAGEIIKQVAAVAGGGGGGKPEFAQAGGKDASKIAEALALAERLLN